MIMRQLKKTYMRSLNICRKDMALQDNENPLTKYTRL